MKVSEITTLVTDTINSFIDDSLLTISKYELMALAVKLIGALERLSPVWIDVTKQPPEVGQECWFLEMRTHGSHVIRGVFRELQTEMLERKSYGVFVHTGTRELYAGTHYLPLSALPELPTKEG